MLLQQQRGCWFNASGGSSTLGERVFVCRSCERRSQFILSQHTLAPCCSSMCFLDKLPSHVLHNCVDTSQWLKPNKQSPEFLLRQRSEDIETRRTKATTATTCRGLLFLHSKKFFFVDNEMLLKTNTLPEAATRCSTVVRGDTDTEGHRSAWTCTTSSVRWTNPCLFSWPPLTCLGFVALAAVQWHLWALQVQSRLKLTNNPRRKWNELGCFWTLQES